MLIPTEDHVVIIEEKAEQTESGLILTGTDNQELTRGRVVQIGPGRWTDYNHVVPIRLHVDDIVHYHKRAAMIIRQNGVAYSVVKAGAIVVIEAKDE